MNLASRDSYVRVANKSYCLYNVILLGVMFYTDDFRPMFTVFVTIDNVPQDVCVEPGFYTRWWSFPINLF